MRIHGGATGGLRLGACRFAFGVSGLLILLWLTADYQTGRDHHYQGHKGCEENLAQLHVSLLCYAYQSTTWTIVACIEVTPPQ